MASSCPRAAAPRRATAGKGDAQQKETEAGPQEGNQRMDADIQHEHRLVPGLLHALIGDEQILQGR